MIRKFAVAAATFLVCSTGHCIDGVSLETGRGDDQTSLLRIAIVNRWHKAQRPPQTVWRLAGYWELSAGVWDNPEESTADVGLTPAFRFEHARVYVEAAIGVHLVQTRISAHRSFSTALQFGDHVGAGVHSGKYDLGLRIQHISNSGVSHPNPGINFVLMRLQYALE